MFFVFVLFGALTVTAPPLAYGRDLAYGGSEAVIYVTPGQPTQITLPGKVAGGITKSHTSLGLDKRDNYLIVFAQASLPAEGQSIIVFLEDKRSYSLQIVPASEEHPRDASVRITDTREPDAMGGEEETPELTASPTPRAKAPSSSVVGLMREMILIAEFGKSKPPPGYRRSNRYSGEVVLDDGSLQATIDEIFVGPDFWGYVLTVENRLTTTQRLNPASFRLDGTRAVTFERPELAPQPATAEQQIARAHLCKVYIVTKNKRK